MGAVCDRRLLVTGGTGSFGQTVVSYRLDREAAVISVLSRDEAGHALTASPARPVPVLRHQRRSRLSAPPPPPGEPSPP